MRRRLSSHRFGLTLAGFVGFVAFVVLATALPVGCGKSNDGTYVILRFDGSVTGGASIAAIVVDTNLAGDVASATFTAPVNDVITLPTTGYLDIGAGAGTLQVHAIARSAAGSTVGQGDGEGTVTRGKTSTVIIKLFPASDQTDAGADPVKDARADVAPSGADLADAPILSGTGGVAGIPGTGGSTAGTGGLIGGTGGTVAGSGGLNLGTGGLVSGTGGGQGEGGSVPTVKLVFAPEGLTFSSTPVGTDSGPQRLSLTNLGGVAIGPLDVVSQDPGQFVIGANGCTGNTLQPNASCSLTVSFRPSVTSTQMSNLVVSAPTLARMQIPMTGLGMAQLSSIEILPSFYDFGPVDVEALGATSSFTIRNTGNTVSTVNNVVFSAASAEYRVANDGCTGSPLNPSGFCLFSVQFKPSLPGITSNTLNVRTNTGSGVSIPIQGTGKQSAIVSIQLTGNGKGSIQGTGVACSGTTCKVIVDIMDSTLVPSLALQAVPEPSSVFAGYGDGPCDLRPSCTLNVTGSMALTAQFDLR